MSFEEQGRSLALTTTDPVEAIPVPPDDYARIFLGGQIHSNSTGSNVVHFYRDFGDGLQYRLVSQSLAINGTLVTLRRNRSVILTSGRVMAKAETINGSFDVNVNWGDVHRGGRGILMYNTGHGRMTGVQDVDLVPAPKTKYKRILTGLTMYQIGAPGSVKLARRVSGTNYVFFYSALAAGATTSILRAQAQVLLQNESIRGITTASDDILWTADWVEVRE